MNIKETARELCALSGPSGFEEAVSLRAKELLEPLMDEIFTDSLGNVLALRRCGKEGARQLLLDAHLDEVGFIVTEVTEGFLKFAALGGLDARTLPGREVRVLAPEGDLYGVIACLLITGSGLSLLQLKDCKTLNLLPALLVPVVWFLLKSLV